MEVKISNQDMLNKIAILVLECDALRRRIEELEAERAAHECSK